MRKLVRSLRDALAAGVSALLPEQSIQDSKSKWEKLSRQNARYYIVSKQGEGIDEMNFRKTGEETYQTHIIGDALLREKLAPFSDKKVLDVGSGTGRLDEFLAKDFREVHGIDIAAGMVEQARERLKHISNLTFTATDGITYPFPDNSFNFVFSYIVFQHMPSREVVEKNLRETRRVLTSDGIAKIQIRGGSQPFRWQWFYGPAFSETDGIAMAKRAGFRVLKTEGAATKRFWLWLAKA